LPDYYAEMQPADCAGWGQNLKAASFHAEKETHGSHFETIIYLPEDYSFGTYCSLGNTKVSIRTYNKEDEFIEKAILASEKQFKPEEIQKTTKLQHSIKEIIKEIKLENVCINETDNGLSLKWNPEMFPKGEIQLTTEEEAGIYSNIFGTISSIPGFGSLTTPGKLNIDIDSSFEYNETRESCGAVIGCALDSEFSCCDDSIEMCVQCTEKCGCSQEETCSPFTRSCIPKENEMSFTNTAIENMVVAATKTSEETYELTTTSGQKKEIGAEELLNALNELNEETNYSMPILTNATSAIQNPSMKVRDTIVFIPNGTQIGEDEQGSFWSYAAIAGIAGGLKTTAGVLLADDLVLGPAGLPDDVVAIAALGAVGLLAVAQLSINAMQGRTFYIEAAPTISISQPIAPTQPRIPSSIGNRRTVARVATTLILLAMVANQSSPPDPDDDKDKQKNRPELRFNHQTEYTESGSRIIRIFSRLKAVGTVTMITSLLAGVLVPGFNAIENPEAENEDEPWGLIDSIGDPISGIDYEAIPQIGDPIPVQSIGDPTFETVINPDRGIATITITLTDQQGREIHGESRMVPLSDFEAHGEEDAFFNATPDGVHDVIQRMITDGELPEGILPGKPIQAELAVDQLVAVHLTETPPENGVIKTTGQFIYTHPDDGSEVVLPRETIHFALNGSVTSHDRGNWSDAQIAIVVPLSDIISQVDTIRGEDTWIVGELELPSSAVIIGSPEALAGLGPGLATVRTVGNASSLNEAVNSEIENQGFTVATIGDRGWTEVGSVPLPEYNTWTNRLQRLSEELGRQTRAHTQTPFWKIENYALFAQDLLRDKPLDLVPGVPIPTSEEIIDMLASQTIAIHGRVNISNQSQREAFERIQALTNDLITRMEEKYGITLDPELRQELDKIAEQTNNPPLGKPIQAGLSEVYYQKPGLADGTPLLDYPWAHVTGMERLGRILQEKKLAAEPTLAVREHSHLPYEDYSLMASGSVKTAITTTKEAESGAGVLVFNPSTGKMLLFKRSEVDEAGTYSVAGGEQFSEHAIVTAIRELKEETGSLPNGKLRTTPFVYSDGSFSYRTYVLEVDSETDVQISLNWENSEFVWVNKDEALALNLHPGFKAFLDNGGFEATQVRAGGKITNIPLESTRGVYLSYGDVEWDRWGLSSLSESEDAVAIYFEPELLRSVFLTSNTNLAPHRNVDRVNLLTNNERRAELGLPGISTETKTIETYRMDASTGEELPKEKEDRLAVTETEEQLRLLRDAERYYEDMGFRETIHDIMNRFAGVEISQSAPFRNWNPAIVEAVSESDVPLDGLIGFGIRNPSQRERLLTLLRNAGIETVGGRPVEETIVIVDEFNGLASSHDVLAGYYEASQVEGDVLAEYDRIALEAKKLSLQASIIQYIDEVLNYRLTNEESDGWSLRWSIERLKIALRGELIAEGGREETFSFRDRMGSMNELSDLGWNLYENGVLWDYRGSKWHIPQDYSLLDTEFLEQVNARIESYPDISQFYRTEVLEPLSERYGDVLYASDYDTIELPAANDPIWEKIAETERRLDELVADWTEFKASTALDIENVLNTLP